MSGRTDESAEKKACTHVSKHVRAHVFQRTHTYIHDSTALRIHIQFETMRAHNHESTQM